MTTERLSFTDELDYTLRSCLEAYYDDPDDSRRVDLALALQSVGYREATVAHTLSYIGFQLAFNDIQLNTHGMLTQAARYHILEHDDVLHGVALPS